MDSDIKQHLSSRQTWVRGLYILLFALIYSIAEIVLYSIVLFQFLSMLFSGETNDRLLRFSQSLSTYIYQIIQFMTANDDAQPYPFNPWPEGPPDSNHTRRHEPPVSATDELSHDDYQDLT